MAKKKFNLLGFLMWLVGVLVALAVGMSMTGNGALANSLEALFIPTIITNIAGWIVVIVTIVGVILAIIDYFK